MNPFLRIPLALLLGLVLQQVHAQSELDALRFSTTTLSGTARTLGMGGAASTMGADLSSPTLNPAGLGLYRSSDFNLTPAYRSIGTHSAFLDGDGSANASNFGIASLGVALNGKIYKGYGPNRQEATTGVKRYTLAFGYNQIENYYRQAYASGYNPYSSITADFAERAQGIPASTLGEDFFSLTGLAWQGYLIDWIFNDAYEPIDGQYWGVVDSGQVQQTFRREEQGRLNEWYLAGGLNISDYVYLGLNIGIQALRYQQDYTYQEDDINNQHEFYEPRPTVGLEFPFNNLELVETFETRGTGINANLGIILRPVDALRIGISYKTPTVLALTDDFSTTLSHSFVILDGITGAEKDTLASNRISATESAYNVTTPSRLTLGGTFLFGKMGFINGDVEWVNYGSARLRSAYIESDPAYYDYGVENQAIRELFRPAVNFRFGGELRLDLFRLRAGAAFYGSPLYEAGEIYEDFQNPGQALRLTSNRQMITLGGGLRQPNYYVDVAYINQLTKDKVSPYATADPGVFDPAVLNDVRSHSVALSLGLLF